MKPTVKTEPGPTLPRAEAEAVHIVKCNCDPTCMRYGLSDGTFYQGCGWDKATAELHALAFNSHQGSLAALRKALNALIPKYHSSHPVLAEVHRAIRAAEGVQP